MSDRSKKPAVNKQQLHAWRGYFETFETLRSLLASRLQSDSGISAGDYQVLLALSEAGTKTLRSSALADLIGWERSRLSHHLGRMEKRGLVSRRRCQADVHGVDVALTELGSETFHEAARPHLRAIQELFLAALTPEQLVQVEGITGALRGHLNLGPVK